MQDLDKASVPCPTCGNDDEDKLIWEDPEDPSGIVFCVRCGTRYRPESGEIVLPS